MQALKRRGQIMKARELGSLVRKRVMAIEALPEETDIPGLGSIASFLDPTGCIGSDHSSVLWR
jgi:hypothetical protein